MSIRQENCPPLRQSNGHPTKLSEWANYYCINGIRATVPTGKMSTEPNDDTHLRTGYEDCPPSHTCSLGIAHPNFEWDEPTGCRQVGNTPQSETPVQFYVLETQGAKDWSTQMFQTRVYADDDDSNENTVTYSIQGYPTGCRGDDPITSTNSNDAAPNFLRLNDESNGLSVDNGKASQTVGRLKTAMLLNKEVCTTSYTALITATISGLNPTDGVGVVPNTIECLININILDVNEPPSVIKTSLPGHKVDEGSLPATTIGIPTLPGDNPLEATDPEADIGLQQLVWNIISCKGVSPAGVVSSELSPNNCPIRIGACDGQLMVSEGGEIDYET